MTPVLEATCISVQQLCMPLTTRAVLGTVSDSRTVKCTMISQGQGKEENTASLDELKGVVQNF